MADEDNGGKIVWIVAGIAIGATIALLYAPSAGKVIRRKIVRGAEDSKTAISGSARDMLERGREMYEKGRKLADEAAELYDHGRKLFESTASSLKG